MGDVIIDGTVGANRLLILDANGKIPAVDGSAVTNVAGANFSTGTIPVARIDTGTTANKVVKLDGNAKLPAVSGAALTGVAGATKSASDPTPSTNPSGGVGTEWHNTSTGEVYICTTATAGANIWKNVGGLAGDISGWRWQGAEYGYVFGGYSGGTRFDNITRYSFASDANASDGGNLSEGKNSICGTASSTYGYGSGGQAAPAKRNTIERFPFANFSANVTDVGDLDNIYNAGCSNGFSDGSYGYNAGGSYPGDRANQILKYQLVASANSTDRGDLTVRRSSISNTQSLTHGYSAGGTSASGVALNHIDKWAFANSINATDVGDTTTILEAAGAASSTTHGYAMSGDYTGDAGGNLRTTNVQKWPYASDSNSALCGNMTIARSYGAGASSTTHGYMMGGNHGSDINNIDKIAFASDGFASDVGDLITATGSQPGSCQF